MDNKQTIIDNNARIDAITQRLNNTILDSSDTSGRVLVLETTSYNSDFKNKLIETVNNGNIIKLEIVNKGV